MAKNMTLLIMAAGMGSRYGGMKQIDHMDDEGHKILDFSIYDAIQAGFDKAVFVIKKENQDVFRSEFGDRLNGHIKVEYAFQELSDIPVGFEVPADRAKPWGTAHAVRAARSIVKEPFAVINADDFYGRGAFEKAAGFLSSENKGSDISHYAMVGYELKNTLTENGTVSRGICRVSDEGLLEEVVERTKIRKTDAGAEYTEDDGKTWEALSVDSATSMNFWCFTPDFMDMTEKYFTEFMKENVPKDPMKAECYLPAVVSSMLTEGKCDVTVLKTSEVWHGVTYKEDKPALMEAIKEMKKDGTYPDRLWN